MTDSTNMETYDASASDCLASQPPLLSSRKQQYRKLHSRKSPSFKRRILSYKRRRAKRIKESDDPELSSSDEIDPPPPPLTKGGYPNSRFLPYMPRPSDIVPAIEDGSASDAGFNPRAREVHKRRKEAARILLASIDTRGNLLPVPGWKRNRSGLSKYNAFMDPPKEDMDLPNLRVPLPLLSRFYRGSLLAVHRVGRPRRERKTEPRESESPEASAFECENLESSSQSDWEASEQPTVVKPEPVEIHESEGTHTGRDMDKADSSEKNSEEFSKAAFLEELEKVAGGSSDSLSEEEMERLRQNGRSKRDTTGEGGAKVVSNGGTEGNGNTEKESERESRFPAKHEGQSKSTTDQVGNEIQNPKPKNRTEIDVFRNMLSFNSEFLFEERKAVDTEATIVKTIDIEQPILEEEEESSRDLTEFQKDQRLSALFSYNTTKRPRSKTIEMTAKYLNPPKRRKCGDSPADRDSKSEADGPEARMNMKFMRKVMGKMGFTGRLGKNQDGRKDPVLPTVRTFRSGIGSNQGLAQTRTGDQSLLPITFKGKSAGSSIQAGNLGIPVTLENGDPSSTATSLTQSATTTVEDGDVFTARRKRKRGASTKGSNPQKGTSRSKAQSPSANDKNGISQLDGDDIYETDMEEDGIDNGRRAILVDIDALIKGSSQRRLNAIEKVLADASLMFDVKRLLKSESRDLCEADLLCLVLGHANVKPHDMEGFKEKLDEAFESLPLPELDNELVDLLRKYSKEIHFGVFHRGSRRRLQYDLKATGLNNTFLQEVCVTVKPEEKWPYVDTWQDLVCRVGVRSRQCLLILNETRAVPYKGDWRPSTGATAGAMLGAKTAAWERTEKGASVHITNGAQKERVVTISDLSTQLNIGNTLKDLIKDRMPKLKRRRVLAQFEDDLLWYSAVVMFEGTKDKKCLIKFNKFENTDWVLNEDLVSLCRRDFRKMKEMDFPGLLDSDPSVL